MIRWTSKRHRVVFAVFKFVNRFQIPIFLIETKLSTVS